MKEYIKKADILTQAIPYIQKFKNKIVVIKYGGTVLNSKKIESSILRDIVFLNAVGIKPVIVHGGGPNITKEIEKKGRSPEFIDGLRVTTYEDIKIVSRILKKINCEVVKKIKKLNAKAKGFANDENLIQTKSISKKLGFVGEISKVKTGKIKSLLDKGYIPVVAPLGKGKNQKIYNVNADRVSSELSVALKSVKLVLLTHVDGILEKPDNEKSLISTLYIKEMKKFIDKSVITGGMIPKVKAGCFAIKKGVEKVHIINGNIPHALLLEIFTDKGIGTQIIKR